MIAESERGAVECLTDGMTAISESVRLETVAADVGDIALVIVDNPPVNALSWHVRQGLFDGINQAVEAGAKAIVVICDGRTFIAGADISEFGGNVPQAAGLHEVQAAMENAAVPVIAAIHGTALGAPVGTSGRKKLRARLRLPKNKTWDEVSPVTNLRRLRWPTDQRDYSGSSRSTRLCFWLKLPAERNVPAELLRQPSPGDEALRARAVHQASEILEDCDHCIPAPPPPQPDP